MGVLKKFSLFRKTKTTAIETFDASNAENGDSQPTTPQHQEAVEEAPPPPEPSSLLLPRKPVSPALPPVRPSGSFQLKAKAAPPLTPTAEHDDEIEFIDESLAARGFLRASSPIDSSIAAAPAAAAASAELTPEVAPAAISAAAVPKRSHSVTFQVPEATPDVPLEEIYAGVSEAFDETIASSLQSSKWDKRAEAIKAISAILKGQGIQGMAKPGSTGILLKGISKASRVKSWRVAVQLLHHSMKDKVMPVRLASYDLFYDAFTNVSMIDTDDVRGALTTLFKHLLCGLGDSNARVHEGARKNVLLAAEGHRLLGLSKVLEQMRAKLAEQQVVRGKTSVSGGRITTASKGTNERTKTIFGLLDCANLLLGHFPGRRAGDDDDEDEEADEDSWTQHCIKPFIIEGMDDSLGIRVRGSALELAVTAYQTLGGEAMEPVLAMLRPAKQQLLKQRFQESEDGDCDENGEVMDGQFGHLPEVMPSGGDFSDLMICGTRVKPLASQSFATPLPGSLGCDEEEPINEELMMDGILDETGAAFASTGMMMHELRQAQCHEEAMCAAMSTGEFEEYELMMREEEFDLSPSVGIGASHQAPTRLMHDLHSLEQEHWMLENELLSLGANIDREQEAILHSIQAQEKMGRRAKNPDDEVAVLLGSLGDHSLSSLGGIVEVC